MSHKLMAVSCVFIIMATLVPSPGQADEITLDNGNRLTGTVVDIVGETLTFSTDYAEPMKIKSGRITAIATDKPVELHLRSGEIIKGKLSTETGGKVFVAAGDGRNPTGVDMKSIAALNPPPTNKWHGSLSVAGNLQSGNTDRSGLSFAAEANRRGETDRFSMRFIYNIAQENGSMTTRNAFGALQYDYFFTQTLFGYLGVELLNDTFKDLNLRTVVGPGVGYQVWEDPKKMLALEAGIAYFSEDLKVQEDKRWVTLRLAANCRYNLTDWLLFTDRLALYPSLESFSDFTLRNEAALLTGIGSGWSLKLADILDYVNNPPLGKKSTDSILTAGLQYAF